MKMNSFPEKSPKKSNPLLIMQQSTESADIIVPTQCTKRGMFTDSAALCRVCRVDPCTGNVR